MFGLLDFLRLTPFCNPAIFKYFAARIEAGDTQVFVRISMHMYLQCVCLHLGVFKRMLCVGLSLSHSCGSRFLIFAESTEHVFTHTRRRNVTSCKP